MKEIWLAFKEWLIRKFDVSEEPYDYPVQEIQYLRQEREKDRERIAHLTELVLEYANPNRSQPANAVPAFDPTPITRKGYTPWSVQRQQLEMKDRERALKLHDEAKLATENRKSTEQLEKEILGE